MASTTVCQTRLLLSENESHAKFSDIAIDGIVVLLTVTIL